MSAQARLCRQHEFISGVHEFLRYDLRPMVMTVLLRRRKPSTIDAWRTLVTFLGKATSGEFAILRTATENATSERIRSHSSSRDVSVPAISFSAFSAIDGKGGILSGSHLSSIGSAAFEVLVACVIAFRALDVISQFRKRLQ